MRGREWKPGEGRITVANTGCWTWTGSRTRDGYGILWLGRGRRVRAHRAAYEFFCGPIPAGLFLDHLCRNRACVNPEHLEPVTNRVNVLRGETFCAENAAKTECDHGHEFTPENTRVDKRGWRHCRPCQRRRDSEYRDRRRVLSEGVTP